MRASVFTASCTALLVATLCAQTADQLGPFSEAVRVYQDGNFERTSDMVAGWSRRDLERVASARVLATSFRVRETQRSHLEVLSGWVGDPAQNSGPEERWIGVRDD